MRLQLSKHSLYNFFSGSVSPLQKKLIEEWIGEKDNTEQYYERLEEWEREHPQFLPDTEKALQHFLLRLKNKEMTGVADPVPERKRAVRFQWAPYAAAAVLLGAMIYSGWDLIQYKTYKTEFGEIRTLSLRDGSKITLNTNSSLQIPRFGFGSRTREVRLQGEAEFSVVHRIHDQPFLVRTPDHLEVEVLGTEFVVYSRDRGSKVVLHEGKILLRSLHDTVRRAMAIKPGDVVTIHNGVFKLKEKQPTQIHSAWKEHRFVFDHTSLQEIAFQMEESFGVKIQIADTLLAEREVTGTYEAADAQDLLEVLAKVLDIEMKQTGKRVDVMMNSR
jgi:ferric-dicitrate binding protein FerR (iron transport regulator)